MSKFLKIFLFLSIYSVSGNFADYVYKGNWESFKPIESISASSGDVLIRYYYSEDDTVHLSILFQSTDPVPKILYIQTGPILNTTEYIELLNSPLTLYTNNKNPTKISADLSCTLNKNTAECKVSKTSFILQPLQLKGHRVGTNDMQQPIVSYSFIISCVSITLILAFSRQTQDCIASESVAKKTPIEFLILQSAIDLWYSIWHLYLSIIYYMAHEYLILAGFMTFAVYLVIHGRLLMHCWKAQNPSLAQDGILLFKIRFSIFESFWVMFILSFIPVFIIIKDYKILIVFISHSYLPLIYNSARYGYKNSVKPDVIVTITLARLFLLLYLFGFSHEFMLPAADYVACLAFVLYLGVQVLVVLLQNKQPRFFLPKICRPVTYSFFRDEEYERILEKSDCIICMTELNLAGNESSDILNYSRTMHTPCKHMFHEDCLGNWMNLKMECPTCRTPLPIVEE